MVYYNLNKNSVTRTHDEKEIDTYIRMIIFIPFLFILDCSLPILK
jgi:hypothetical protein